jgi:CheY-like chemotaxis protein
MRALNRVSDDGGTIKVFGVEVNVGKATEEQQRLIEDLQKQVGTLRDAIDVQTGNSPVAPSVLDPSRPRSEPHVEPVGPESATKLGSPVSNAEAVGAAPAEPDCLLKPRPNVLFNPHSPARLRPAAPRLLWVDDHPENNVLIAASLRQRGFIIVDAIDTAAALDRFVARGFDAVVSDMGRDTADAGVTLTQRIRALDFDVPIFIFCSVGAARIYGDFAQKQGATLVTESATLLMQRLLELQEGG